MLLVAGISTPHYFIEPEHIHRYLVILDSCLGQAMSGFEKHDFHSILSICTVNRKDLPQDVVPALFFSG